MSGPKQPLADDLAQADTLHREALHKIVYDMAAWLRMKRSNHRREAARFRSRKEMGTAHNHAEIADVYGEAFEKLRQLRDQYGEQSARQSFFHYAQEETGEAQILTDPTPEEIADMTAKIREGWTESTYQLRASQKTLDADTPVIKCDHLFR